MVLEPMGDNRTLHLSLANETESYSIKHTWPCPRKSSREQEEMKKEYGCLKSFSTLALEYM